MPEASEPASQLVIGVQVNDIDSTLKADNDSLTVEEIRFIHGKSFFTISEDSTIQLTGRAHQLSYKGTTRQGTQLIYPFPPGAPSPFPEGVYQGLTFKIVRAESVSDDTPGFDPDPAFTNGGNYSIIINGTYNDKDFTFKASKGFEYNFKFTPPVSVSSEAKVYRFLISTDLSDWFKAENADALLDPSIDENKTLIYDNIQSAFTIEQVSSVPDDGN
ncbi:MAG TPA: hypothetical protein VK106_00560 [Balneolaceae bacterium]|nr:hypothetical protein [Balneolaceae bacterium]